MPQPEKPDHDLLIDCVGQVCPLPVLRARKALQNVSRGDVVRVESSDPMAIVDVPHMAHQDGHEVMDRVVEGDRSTFWIKRGSA